MTTVSIPQDKRFHAFAALYNASKPQGLGFLNVQPGDMTPEGAEYVLSQQANNYVDYHQGRIIKTDFSGGETQVALYDRDNGEGAAAKALEGII